MIPKANVTHALRLWSITFCLFLILGLVLVWSHLRYPMAYDDLHLIRSFSVGELQAVLHGPWDVDKVETPGLRPLTVMFNHLRFVLFGENVVNHRLFLVGLYALYLAATVYLARVFGLPWMWGVAAGTLSMASRYNVTHYVWLADGIHLAQGCSFAATAVLLLRWLHSGKAWQLVGSLLAALGALLIREDTLAVIPVVVLLGYVYMWQHNRHEQLPRLHRYTVALGVICGLGLVYRRVIVPEAQPFAFSVSGLVHHLVLSFGITGVRPFDGTSSVLVYGWLGLMGGLTLVCAFRHRSLLGWRTRLWLGCLLCACTPGLTLARSNLLLFSTTFAMVGLASILHSLSIATRTMRYIAPCVVVWGLAGAYYASTATAQSFHPHSLTVIEWNSEFIYGPYSNTTIPSARRAAITNDLARFGITSAVDVDRLPMRAQAALQAGHRRPNGQGEPFIPRLTGVPTILSLR